LFLGGLEMLVAQKSTEVQHGLLERLMEARARTDELFSLVRPDALYERPIPERHRIIFYLGHLEAFDWNLLRERVVDLDSFHPEFDHLFAFGIDPTDGGLPSDQPGDWPSVQKVRDYVDRVREALDEGLTACLSAESEAAAKSQENSPHLLLNVAIEHRLMHAETLTYMLHQLPLDRKIRPARMPALVVPSVRPTMVEIPAGSTVLGLSSGDANTFGWDNEYETHTVAVPSFAIDRYMVTNGQYAEFMAAEGYDNRTLWADADWKWKTECNITHPVRWKRAGDRWNYETMFNEVPLPLDWPVYVSHAEATAYARWVRKVLPTEAQWHRAAYGTAEGFERPYPWGVEEPSPRLGNFDGQSWDPTPVGGFVAGQSAFGVADLLGNGWEWTSSVFEPFPGFAPFPFYRGYSADFFDGHHYVMKGGSARTAACMLRRSFRNWFQTHYQYVYSGFRCASN
jgi:gamma-glutamyl hercynylcysteine S-oxide synthase